MSTRIDADFAVDGAPADGTWGPELSSLGKRIERLRIERGISKQHLARCAGTSRQQLWRVITGKSELTNGLAHRLADALRVPITELREEPGEGAASRAGTPTGDAARPLTFAAFVGDPALLRRALAELPADEPGRRLRRELLNAVEELAGERGVRLPDEFFALRGRVVNGEL